MSYDWYILNKHYNFKHRLDKNCVFFVFKMLIILKTPQKFKIVYNTPEAMR